MLGQHDPTAPEPEGTTTAAGARPRLRVEAWRDPVIDQVGYDTRSAYVETFWLPVLGPSSVWLLRHLTTRLEASPEGVVLDVEETARSLGLGERLGPNAPFARTIKRCVDFAMAEWRAEQVLAVRLKLPPLARRHIRRLPESLQLRYDSAQGVMRRETAQIGSGHDEQGQDLSRDGTRARADL